MVRQKYARSYIKEIKPLLVGIVDSECYQPMIYEEPTSYFFRFTFMETIN